MNRTSALGEVLESVVSWSRRLGATAGAPFRGVQLTRSQREALFLIAHRPMPMSPGLLAHELRPTPGAVTQLLDGLRQAGLVVRGVYGPAYEEWGAYNMPPQP